MKLDEAVKSVFKKDKGILVAIVICSSTGDGDMPENGDVFAKNIRKQANAVKELVDMGKTCK